MKRSEGLASLEDNKELDKCLKKLYNRISKAKPDSQNEIEAIQISVDKEFPVFLINLFGLKAPEKYEERKVLVVSKFVEELRERFKKEKEAIEKSEGLRASISKAFKEVIEGFMKQMEAAKQAIENDLMGWWPVTEFLEEFQREELGKEDDFLSKLEALARNWLIKRETLLEKGQERIEEIKRMVEGLNERLGSMESIPRIIKDEKIKDLFLKRGSVVPEGIKEEEKQGRESESIAGKEEFDVGFKGFSKDSPVEITEAKRGAGICLNQGGIPRTNQLSSFAALGWDGSLALFDGLTGTLTKETKLEVIGEQYVNSSAEFSPSGNYLLVSICSDKKLEVLRTDQLSLKPNCSWVNAESTSIRKARWIDEETILAAFNCPGELAVYKLGEKEPILTIKPEETKESAICDIDFSLNREEAFCGSGNQLVFRIGITQGDSSIKWKHNGHLSRVNVVRLSPNGRMVLTGGDDNAVLLTDAKNGSVLFSFDGFSHNSVYGAIWHPSNQVVVVSSYNEIIMFKVKSTLSLNEAESGSGSFGASMLSSLSSYWNSLTKGEASLRKMDQKSMSFFGKNSVLGLNAQWGTPSKGEKAFILVGDDVGNIFRCHLE